MMKEVFMSWQEKWEEYAEMERQQYGSSSVSELIEYVRNGHWGNYYTIWYVLAERATPGEAAEPLFRVLKGTHDYLYRYHAAAAILKITGIESFRAVDLSGSHSEVAGNLETLEAILREKGFLKDQSFFQKSLS